MNNGKGNNNKKGESKTSDQEVISIGSDLGGGWHSDIPYLLVYLCIGIHVRSSKELTTTIRVHLFQF